MMRRPLSAAFVVCLLAAWSFACGTTRGPAAPPHMQAADYPGELVDSQALPRELELRQRIVARFGAREMSFSAVLQTEGGVLSLLALTPFGTRAFLIAQRGQQIEYTRYVDMELPFPPRFILLDVHRTLFVALPGAPLSDGEHRAQLHGEEVIERWRGGRLLERSFRRLDGHPKGEIRIRFGDGSARETIELDNGWFGYRLSIHNLSQ